MGTILVTGGSRGMGRAVALKFAREGHDVGVTYEKNRAAAEDATQETLVRVWKALPGFDGRAALGTWIYAITRNTCLMELRRRRPTVSFDDPDSTEAQHAAARPHVHIVDPLRREFLCPPDVVDVV